MFHVNLLLFPCESSHSSVSTFLFLAFLSSMFARCMIAKVFVSCTTTILLSSQIYRNGRSISICHILYHRLYSILISYSNNMEDVLRFAISIIQHISYLLPFLFIQQTKRVALSFCPLLPDIITFTSRL